MPETIYYECQRCTNCCRWPGLVRIDEAEIGPMAAFLGMPEHDFIQRYTKLRPQRDGLALVDKGPHPDGTYNHECVFLEGRDCAIQAVKPRQCAGFPNTWSFPGWREACEARPVLRRVDG
jgi:Fe-S-cluster containining protein